MKIKETKTMPNPSGFGWGEYTQVRDIAPEETVPAGAETVSDDTPNTEWVSAALPFTPTSIVATEGTPAAAPPKASAVTAPAQEGVSV